jgi:hypothetical protein
MSGINSIYDSYSKAPVNSKAVSKVKDTDKETKTAEAAAESTAEKTSAKKTDSFERSAKANANTYTKGVATEHAGKSALNIKNEGMKDMVAQLLGQAKSGADKNKGLTLDSILKSFDIEPIESDGSEDFWGAEKTANRILDFAKSLAKNDPESFKKVKDAFEKGFAESEKIWGDKLPSVSYDTLDLVRQGFDDWEKEINAQADAVSTQAAAQ